MAKSMEDVHEREGEDAAEEIRRLRKSLEMGGEERREGRNERETGERAGERRKEEREGEVSLSIARRREATELFSVTIISSSRARKRGARRGRVITCNPNMIKHDY